MKTASKTAQKTQVNKTTKKYASLNKAAKAKQALTGRLQTMGLLEQPAVDRLDLKADALTKAPGSGVDQASAWDRALSTSLSAFEAGGGDGSIKRSLQALVLWQETISGLRETTDGLKQALTALKKVIPYAGATIFLRTPDREQVLPLVSVGFEVDLISRIRFAEGMGFSSWVATRKKPVLYSTLHRNEAPDSDQVRSFISVPLVVAGDCVGVLNLGHNEEEAYNSALLRRGVLAGGILAGLVQRHVATKQIEAREIRDAATGLATPVYLRNRLEEEVIRCRELGHSMSLLVVRLKELGEFTNQFGSSFKERCRGELAALIQEWQKPTELIGHGENDTVVVVLPGARRDHAEARADLLTLSIRHHNFPRRKRMSAGIGIGTYPADAEDPQELLEWVDKISCQASRVPQGPEGVGQAMTI